MHDFIHLFDSLFLILFQHRFSLLIQLLFNFFLRLRKSSRRLHNLVNYLLLQVFLGDGLHFLRFWFFMVLKFYVVVELLGDNLYFLMLFLLFVIDFYWLWWCFDHPDSLKCVLESQLFLLILLLFLFLYDFLEAGTGPPQSHQHPYVLL